MKTPKFFRSTFQRYKWTGETVGDGPTGSVVKATDPDGRLVAIKTIDPTHVTDEARREMRKELAFCLQKTHPTIVDPIDFGNVRMKNKDTPFIVMPYFESNLRTWVRRTRSREDWMFVLRQLLDGVETAHLLGVTHGHLKPENILMNEDGRLAITDWGMSRFVEANSHYRAPEQQDLAPPIDPRVDIYALGKIIQELFAPESIAEHSASSPEPNRDLAFLVPLAERMVTLAPESRFSTIDELKKRILVEHSIHVARQRLHSLKRTVVPHRTIDDPLITNPIALTGERDYRDGALYLMLTQPATYGWTLSFRSVDPGHVFFDRELRPKDPKSFVFKNDEVHNPIEPENAQQLVDCLKRYVDQANEKYKSDMEAAARSCELAEWETLEKQVEAETERVGVIETLKF